MRIGLYKAQNMKLSNTNIYKYAPLELILPCF
jgi:hypothetical protein